MLVYSQRQDTKQFPEILLNIVPILIYWLHLVLVFQYQEFMLKLFIHKKGIVQRIYLYIWIFQVLMLSMI